MVKTDPEAGSGTTEPAVATIGAPIEAISGRPRQRQPEMSPEKA